MSEPCIMQATIMKHAESLGKLDGVLAGLASDVSYIRRRVDDGLAVTVARIDKDLTASIAEGKINVAELQSENWFNRILTGSVSKLIGMGIVFIVFSALASSGMGVVFKEYYSKEPPGQQKEILLKQAAIQSTLIGYHSHLLPDGRTLFHSGDATKPAWILDPKTNAWEKSPGMRTEDGIKQ